MQSRFSRRGFFGVFAAGGAAVLLAACSTAGPAESPPSAPAATTSGSAPATSGSAAAPTAAPASGNATQATPASSASTNGTKVTLQYGSWAGTTTEPLHRQAIIKAFNKVHPEITVKFFYANGNDYMTKMKTLFAAGTAWDVMQVAADTQYPQFNAGLFMPLDDRARGAKISKDDFFGSMWDSLIWNGKLYAIPLGGASGALAYNKDIFDKANIPYPTDDMDWNQVFALCKELTHGSGLQKQFGLAWDMWGEHWEWFNGGYPISPSTIMTGESHDYRPLESNEGAESVTEGRQFRWKLMFGIKALPNAQEMQAFGKGTDMGSPTIFMGGHAAMNFDGSWSVATWQKGIKFNWDVARAPKWPNGKRSGWITVNGTGVNAKTQYPEQAWTFDEFFSTQGLQILADSADFYPSKPGLVDAWLKSGGGTPKNGKVFSDSMSEGTLKRGSWYQLFAPNWGDYTKAIDACFDPSTGKGLNDIPPAQKAAEKSINELIAKDKPPILKQLGQA